MSVTQFIFSALIRSVCFVTLVGIVYGESDCDCNRTSGIDVSKIRVHSYNNEYNSHDVYRIDEAARRIFSHSTFDVDQCIDIYIPDYNTPISDSTISTAKCIISQVVCNKKGTLLIIIDHTAYTTAVYDEIKEYKNAVKHAKSIGVKIGSFILMLLYIIDKDLISIMGHGLGGHIAGYAAQFVNEVREPLPVVYAADPAGPCFTKCPREHVRSGQADRVITIHCTDTEGSTLNVADIDAYANDGKKQPGCVEDDYKCNHRKCVSIALLPSVRDNIWSAKKCSSYEHFLVKKCKRNFTMLVGYRKSYPLFQNGLFYFNTYADIYLKCKLI